MSQYFKPAAASCGTLRQSVSQVFLHAMQSFAGLVDRPSGLPHAR